jgi:hypothetical protein
MIVIGAHYLPFVTLYGMKMFGILEPVQKQLPFFDEPE